MDLNAEPFIIIVNKTYIFKREIKTTLFLSYFDLYLYNIVLACCMCIDITVYLMLSLCCIYNGIDFLIY